MEADPTKASSSPPPVSSGEWTKRLTENIDKENRVLFGTLFSLSAREKDPVFIKLLLSKVTALCTVMDIYSKKIFTPATSKSVSFLNSYGENVDYL